jgi:signal transduction histidine kinase
VLTLLFKATTRVAPTNEKIIVKINNKGEPISPERLKLFFEKFNSDRLKKKDGTGLGTTYVYLVTKAHGGDIFVEPDEISGTTVTLTFNSSNAENVIDSYNNL